MSQLTITLSDKADALIAQLQKEIFNRRRKKVSAAGVIETLVESGAKSQSDKRFATSWSNLVADIEKAARVAHANGAKPANLSDEEWALVLSHRTRAVTTTTAKGRSGRAQAKGPKPRVSTRAKGDRAAAIDPAAANAAAQEPKAAVKRTAKAKPAAKASRTPLKSTPAPTEDAKAVTKPRTTRAKATQAGAKPAPKSTGRRSSPASSGRAGRRTSTMPAASAAAADNAAIPSAAAATTRSRRKVSSTPTKTARTGSARASAATRMAKAANRLGATTNPSPVAEPAPMALASGSNGSGPAAEAESL